MISNKSLNQGGGDTLHGIGRLLFISLPISLCRLARMILRAKLGQGVDYIIYTLAQLREPQGPLSGMAS